MNNQSVKPSELKKWKEIEGNIGLLKLHVNRPQDYLWYYSLSAGKYLPHRRPTQAEKEANQFGIKPGLNKAALSKQ